MWNRDRSARLWQEKPATDIFDVPVAPPVFEHDRAQAAAAPATAADDAAAAAPAEPVASTTPRPAAGKGSVLGPSLRFKGELVADEDLVVQGRVEGSILHTRSLTIGPDGRMKGDIRARRIAVDGHVEGDLYALECVTVRATGQVLGNIFAPRVAIAEGARFNGRIDMDHAPSVPSAMRVGATATELTAEQVSELLSGGD